jgi:hypothetical protein
MPERLPCLLLLAGSLAATACSTPRTAPVAKPPACAHGQPMTRTYLFFGQKTARGRPIAATRWQRFLRTAVTRTFPEGFTVIDARGFWRARQGHTLWEGAKVVIRLHRGRPADDAGIEALRRRYKAQFRQQSVLRIDEPVCASF